MSIRSFLDAMPDIMDHGSVDIRKRAKVHDNGVSSMPAITEHRMESRYAGGDYPHIDSQSTSAFPMQADNALDSSAVNPVVSTILLKADATKITKARGEIISVMQETVSSSDHHHTGVVEWGEETPASGATPQSVLMVLSEAIDIPANSSRVISVSVYGPVLVNLGDESSDKGEDEETVGGTKFVKSKYVFTDTKEASDAATALQGTAGSIEKYYNPRAGGLDSDYLRQGQFYRLMQRENEFSFVGVTYLSPGPFAGSHYVCLHPTASFSGIARARQPIFGAYEKDT